MSVPTPVDVLLILGLYLIIIIIALTILWRVMLALEKTARSLTEMAQDIKKLAANSQTKQ